MVSCCTTCNELQQEKLRNQLTTIDRAYGNDGRMAKITKIHASKQPMRPHFIKEWAERRGLSQAEFAEEVGADKSQVSRWFRGQSPGKDWQKRLAAFFDCSEEALFRDPDDDWMTRFLRGRPAEEIERIKQTIEVAFPRKKINN